MELPEGFIVVGPDATREECIAAWVANLRNPNVRQAKRRLKRRDGSMCCLGVLEATVGLMSPMEAMYPRLEACNRVHLRTRDGGYDIVKTKGMRDYYGLLSLAGKNDSGATFSEIADLIESRPPGLFTE